MIAAAGPVPERWIGLSRPVAAAEMRLFALPYAGAGASAYRRWISDLGHAQWLEFIAVQLPGREGRSAESAHRDIEAALDELEAAIAGKLDLPFVLFGYSLGALLAYELAIRLALRGNPPELLVVAARAPSPRGTSARGRPPSREIVVEKIRRLGGTAPTLIESPLFDSHYLPMLQADFALADGHRRAVPQILPHSVLALAASDDPEVPIARAREWEAIDGGGFAFERFEGGHFFIHEAHPRFLAVLEDALARVRPQGRA